MFFAPYRAFAIFRVAILVALTSAAASSAYAHSISHGGSGPRAAHLSQQSEVAGSERVVTERYADSVSGVTVPFHCPAGSGGGCCCVGRAALSDAAMAVIAASYALWFVVPRRIDNRARAASPVPRSTVLISAPPRAPPISI